MTSRRKRKGVKVLVHTLKQRIPYHQHLLLLDTLNKEINTVLGENLTHRSEIEILNKSLESISILTEEEENLLETKQTLQDKNLQMIKV